MAEETKKKTKAAPKNPMIGAQAVPTTLDTTTKLDIDINKQLIDSIINTSVEHGLDIGKLEDFTNISNARSQVYDLVDTMANDAAVSAILKTYAEEVCETADNGHIIWCESTDPNISRYVNYILNVMNADKNIYAWVYCLLKYGDTYLKLYRESDYTDPIFKKETVDYAASARHPLNEDFDEPKVDDDPLKESVNVSIHKANDHYSYYVEMVPDPGTMFELVKYGRTYGFIETPNVENGTAYLNNYLGTNVNSLNANFKMKSNEVNIYQADDFVHACLEDNFTRFPEKVDIFTNDEDYKAGVNSQAYTVKRGKSILYDAYKVWREKSLLENSILLNRVTRSSVVRNIAVEVGDMPKSQVQNTLRRVKEMFEQKTAINTNTGMAEYSNPGPVENNIYTATHNGQGAITVNAIGGDIEVKNLADLDSWINKFYAAFGIPKQYFSETDDGAGFNGGTSLSITSSVFAKGVKRVQNTIIQAITDAINLILLDRGCKAYLNNFVLKMKMPLTQEEKDYREDLTNRISAISNMQSLFADVEDRSRKLEILKELISTLNYGDGILQIIDEEIADAESQKAKAAEEAAVEAEKETSEETSSETNGEEPLDLDLDLGNSSEVPMESFTSNSDSEFLVEEKSNDIDLDSLVESDDLPTPEELDETIDFSENL